jgi:predicted nucleic acid-binding protein
VAELATSSVTAAEIGAGIAALPAGARQRDLRERWQRLRRTGFGEDRVLPFDTTAADVYGELFGKSRRSGRPVGAFDLQIAAIASVRGLRVVTRNVRDFADLGVDVLNPWSAEPTPS